MICASVSSASVEEMLSGAGAALEQGAECIEFRIDSLDSPNIESVLSLSSIESETIATFKGESLRMLTGQGLDAVFSAFDHVDIPMDDAGGLSIPGELRGKLLLSFHGEVGSETDASRLIESGLSSAGIVKCISTSHGYALSTITCRAADQSTAGRGRIVAFSMGEEGVLSRIASMRRGHPVSYSRIEGMRSTAPGQLNVEEMLAAREGMVLGIAGSPAAAGHSLSPAIHRCLLSASGLDGVYLRFPVRSGELPGFIDSARYAAIRGFNITMPFKEEAVGLLDSLDSSAEGIGAVNTVVERNGSFTGYNTDTTAISEIVSNLGPASALLFGSGGSARAAAHALRGRQVAICARNVAARNALMKEFGLEEFDGHVDDFDLLVNCTPAGMDGVAVNIPEELSKGKYRAVIDFVYSDHTPFMDLASECSSTYVGGREILARQAVHSFAVWTGKALPYDLALSSLGGGSSLA